ncbi:MAG: hypothetical protein EOM11_09935, partial [Erysipelotrichia bacterium]|nr:hypothetical protein [Erysipelotrichia bacterium]
MKEKLFRAYVRFIRPFTEKWLNDRFDSHTPYDFWSLVKDLPMSKFSDKINAYAYKMDRFGGLVDHAFNFDNPNSFFVDKQYGRDCFLADTPFLVKIEDSIEVKTFEEVYALYNNNSTIYVLNKMAEWIPIVQMVEKQTTKDSILVYGINGLLAVTEDHPIYNGEKFEIVKTVDPHVPSFDYLSILASSIGTLQNEDRELLWAMGFFCADGHAKQYANKKSPSIVLTNTNEAYILKALRILNNTFGDCFEKTNYPSDEQGCIRGGVTLRHKQHKIVFKAANIPQEKRPFVINYFLAFYSESYKKKVPNWVFTASKEGIAQFLDGYWCGNGYKSELRRKEVCIPTKALAMQLKILYKLIDYERVSMSQDCNKNAYIVSATKSVLIGVLT